MKDKKIIMFTPDIKQSKIEYMCTIEEIQSQIVPIARKYPPEIFKQALRWILNYGGDHDKRRQKEKD
jgi:hypothetical protein